MQGARYYNLFANLLSSSLWLKSSYKSDKFCQSDVVTLKLPEHIWELSFSETIWLIILWSADTCLQMKGTEHLCFIVDLSLDTNEVNKIVPQELCKYHFSFIPQHHRDHPSMKY